MAEARKVCHTPTSGKQPTSIPVWKYDAIRAAVLKIVPAEAPGIVAKDLPQLVAALLTDDVRTKLGSITWHTTTVKLNMEVEGELERVPRVKPQRLLRSR